MIFNANLIRLSDPPMPDGNGGHLPPSGNTFERPIRCTVDDPNFVQQREIQGQLKKVTAVLYVPMPMPGGISPVEGGDCTVAQDGQAAASFRLARVKPRVNRQTSHFEIFLEAR